jgi:hypothetical protein
MPRSARGSCALVIFAGVSVPLAAGAAPPVGTQVSVRACPYAGVTDPCLMINGADGTVYNITSASPKPPPGGMIRLRGTVTDKLSACIQGTVLDGITWRALRRKCPN